MRLSSYFLPVLKEAPEEAKIPSHRLMLRAGMVRQNSAGIYTWLPLGMKVLRKIERIVREEQDRAGALEVLMPTIQPADLWQRSGRHNSYGPEMLKITDRQGRAMLYGPTNEEMITDVFGKSASSWRDSGLMLYHIQWKFRDEIRPRFGVMRGREFLMKDTYSFDTTAEGARRSYNKMFIAYLRTFTRLGLKVVPIVADTGPIGGDLSHEFILPAATGESQIYCHKDLLNLAAPGEDIDYSADLAPIVGQWTDYYAAESGKHEPAVYEKSVPPEARLETKGIEVGHIFFFGDKYSRPLDAYITLPGGERVFWQSGSYGIGVSRLTGAIIEAFHDDKGIIWPDPVAPFALGLANLAPEDEQCASLCEKFYAAASKAGLDVLYDDTDRRAGVKLAGLDLIGLPWRVFIGRKSAPNVEISRRDGSFSAILPPDTALQKIKN